MPEYLVFRLAVERLGPPNRLMSVRLAGILALMLNVALYAAWLNLRSKVPTALSPAGAASVANAEKTDPIPPTPSERAAQKDNSKKIEATTPWLRIESADFPTFIRNLRDVGCPERTIRDIVSGEIDRIYEGRRPKQQQVDRFWWTEAERHEQTRREQIAGARLELERRSVLKTLIGVEGRWPECVGNPAEWAIFCWGAAIPEMEAVERACWIVDSAQFQRRYLEAEAGSPLTLDEFARLKAMRDDTLLQIESAIGQQRAGELLQLGSLNQLLGSGNDSGLGAIGITSDDLRRISGLLPRDLTTFDEIIECRELGRFERFVAGLPSEPDAEERMQHLAPLVAKAVGPRRAAQLSRLFDEHWGDAVDFANSQELPMKLAEALSDLRHAAVEESKRLREAPDLEPSDETEQLAEVGETTLLALKQILPGKSYEEYLQRNGEWITNLAKGLKP